MRNSNQLFKTSIENAFRKEIKLNPETMKDANNYVKSFNENKLKGGKSDGKTFEDLIKKHTKKGRSSKNLSKTIKNQLIKGIKVEMEHTKDKKIAKEIAMDHIYEDIKYYDKLKKIENKEAATTGGTGQYTTTKMFSAEDTKKIETKEATTSGSVGGYVTTDAWAKSTKKKDWRGASKTQIPGGQFVSIKKKCKKFPYCNQGDIKALKLYEKESVKEAISRLSKKMNLSENTIKAIIEFELERTIKRNIK